MTEMPGENTFLSIIRQPFIFSVLISSVPFALFILFFTPQFMKNDDVFMLLTVSGYWSGQPDEHMIFSNVIIGGLLKHLYGMIPSINWYSTHLYATYYLSTVLISYSCFKFKPSLMRAVIFLIGFVVLGGYVLLYPTFTTASSMAAQSGIFSIIAFQKDNNQKSWPLAVLGVLMIVLGGLIRVKSMYMILLLSAPLLIWHSWKRGSFRIFILVGIALVLSIGAAYCNKAYYHRDEGWRNFYEYNKTRAMLTDNPNFIYDNETKAVFNQAGWSPNDYLMFRAWFYEDEDVYSKDKLKTILTALPTRWRPTHLDRLVSEAKVLSWYLISSSVFILLCFFLMPLGHKKLAGFSLVMSGAVLMYLLLAYYVPRQGIMAIITFLGFAGIFLATKELGKGRKTRPLTGLTVLLCLFLAASVTCLWKFHKQSTWNENHQDSLGGFVKVIANPNVLYVVWPLAFPYEYISPFSNLEELNSFHIYPLSYISHSPISKEIRTKFGVNNIYKALYERDNVLLMFSPDILPPLKDFIAEHYKASVYFKQLFNYKVTENQMGVYQALKNNEQ
jgi:hypothetical protein